MKSQTFIFFILLILIYGCTVAQNNPKVSRDTFQASYNIDSVCKYFNDWKINQDLFIKDKIVELNYNQDFWLNFVKKLYIEKEFGFIPHFEVSNIKNSKKSNYILSFSNTQNTVKLWNTNNLELKEIAKYDDIQSVEWCDSNKFYLVQKDRIRLIQVEKDKVFEVYKSNQVFDKDTRVIQVNYEKKWFLIQKTIVSRIQDAYYLESFDGKKIEDLGKTLYGYVRTSYDNNFILLTEENKIRVFDVNGILIQQFVLEEGIGHVEFIKDSYDIQYHYQSKIKIVNIKGIAKQELEIDKPNFYDVNVFYKSKKNYYFKQYEIIKKDFNNNTSFEITFPIIKPSEWTISNDENIILLIDKEFDRGIITLYLHPKKILEQLNEIGCSCGN